MNQKTRKGTWRSRQAEPLVDIVLMVQKSNELVDKLYIYIVYKFIQLCTGVFFLHSRWFHRTFVPINGMKLYYQ